MKVSQESVQEVVVLLAEVSEFLQSGHDVQVLAVFVLLEGRGRLVDLRSEPEVGGQDTGLDVLIVAVNKVADSLRDLGVEGGERVIEPHLLLQHPCESAFTDEETRRELSQQRGVHIAELHIEFQVFGEEAVPGTVALREQEVGSDVGALIQQRATYLALRVATTVLTTCVS